MALNPWEYAKKNEHSQQVALFMWANMACRFGLTAADDPLSYSVKGHALALASRCNDKVPQLKWLHAIHNQGHGDVVRGGKAKAEGVKAGVSDLFLPVPIRGEAPLGMTIPTLYCGLYVELKKLKGGITSPEQLEFQADMRAVGYKCEVALGWLDARRVILAYLQINC